MEHPDRVDEVEPASGCGGSERRAQHVPLHDMNVLEAGEVSASRLHCAAEVECDDLARHSLCREGREEGFRQLLARYESYIYSLCFRLTGNREDALDLTQETFIKVINGLDKFQINRAFKPWLRQITVNACYNFLNRRAPAGVSLEQPLDEGLTLADVQPAIEDPAQEVEWRDTRRLLWEKVEQLPPVYRLVLVLRHQEGMSYRDIAEVTRLPEGTVKMHLFRARQLLRRKMAEQYGWEG
jgi:RNA polymerase sigma-70 factor (ECF subfamily)